MSGKLTFREALPGDAAALSRLAQCSKAHWGYSADFMQACLAELTITADAIAEDGSYFEIACDQAELAGFSALEGLSRAEVWLGALFVKPQYIGKGVGRELLDRARARAATLGARSLLIQSDPNALKFYKAAGAVTFAETESDSIPGRMLPTLRLEL